LFHEEILLSFLINAKPIIQQLFSEINTKTEKNKYKLLFYHSFFDKNTKNRNSSGKKKAGGAKKIHFCDNGK